MTVRLRSAVVGALWVCGVGLAATGLAISPAHRGVGDIVVGLAYQLFTTVGAVIAVRRPGHRLGPLFLLSGLLAGVQEVAEAVVDLAKSHHDVTGLGVHVAAWAQSWIWLPTLSVPLVFGLLLFPDGKLPSPRWRPVLRLGAAATAAVVLPFATMSLTVPTSELMQSQPHVHGWRAVAFSITYVGVIGSLICAILGIVAVSVRFRQGDAVTRQQVKLVLLAAVVAVLAVIFGGTVQTTQNVLEPLGTATIAGAVLVAVMRYRLFDIDRLVSRTVTYLVVTGLLIGVYVGLIALTTSLLSFGSSLGVAASTLAAAALFQPVRRRVQTVVDRRFNRQRYDAARTIDRFAVGLRDEVDPETVRADLLTVAAAVMQPERLSLWVAS